MTRLTPLRECEYDGWVIDGVKITPPCAYTDVEFWYDYLLNNKLFVRAINHLRSYPKASTMYPKLSDHLYERILDKLEERCDVKEIIQ